jgi:outer membrane protein insertion porin family
MIGTIVGGFAVPAMAQDNPAGATAQNSAQPATAPQGAPQLPGTTVAPAPTRTVASVAVQGNQRLEPETVLSYTSLRIGEPYDQERLDRALQDLYATELFADVVIAGVDTGNLIIQVRENPVINRIILEGNRRIKDDKITPEIRLAPRQIFTRSRARADVARIIELYRRQGRYAASVEPQIVELDQNRVDVVFEINEGPRSRVRRINIIGNEEYGDRRLIQEMATREHVWYNIFSSRDSYDPDRLAYDQQKLRQFYLTQGYADFRVVSAVAELTPDRRDFIITYVVEEGDRYKFGDLAVESDIRDFSADRLRQNLPMETGDWYNAQQVEDTLTRLNELAGVFGYAFSDVRPQYTRSRENLTMGVTFHVAETPRVYVERIDISGNTTTQDKVIRREFRIAEGDPFNNVRVRRSRDRIQSLGFFQENLEITQEQGSAPDRVVLGVAVEERATGQLQLSAGFSSIERFLINMSIQQRNFRGHGQELRAAVNYSSYSKSVELGFTEPYLFDRNIAVGFDVYRRDLNSFNFLGEDRTTTYEQVTTGGQIRSGVPLTETLQLALRYSLNYDEISLNPDIYFTDPDGPTGPLPAVCNPLIAGRYLCDSIGNNLTSSFGYSVVWDTLNNRLHPSNGERIVFNQDFAGLGGDVHYLRTRLLAAKYWNVFGNFIFGISAEAGYIHSFDDGTPTEDPVRLTDRFFLGSPQIRGFDIRGVGPRIQRIPYLYDLDPSGAATNVALSDDPNSIVDDALGGRAYYLARAELEIPLGASVRELGLRPSVFVDIGALWGVRQPDLIDIDPNNPLAFNACTVAAGGVTLRRGACDVANGEVLTRSATAPFREVFLGDSPSPRLSVGVGVNWNSPFGPFRIDVAHALLHEDGDDTKLFTFNVGTAF